MFTVLYRWRIRPGREAAFVTAWSRMTTIIYERHGSLGSRLHAVTDGTHVAYAQWPSREAWEATDHVAPTGEQLALREAMRVSAERITPDIMMSVIDDKLATTSHDA